MTMLTVRDLDPHVKDKLRRQAARHGRSMEAEVRQILTAAVEAGHEPVDLVSSVREHFADAPIQLELPDRSTEQQRPLDFSA